MYSMTPYCQEDGDGEIQEAPKTLRFYGDFYNISPDENLYRSVTVACQQEEEMSTEAPLGFCSGPSTKWQGHGSKLSQIQGHAPELTSLWPFTVSVTHLTLQSTPPQAWQRCVVALHQHGSVTILKVRPQKYTVLANFSNSGFSCKFKVFIFSVEAEEVGDTQVAFQRQEAVIEFQRRSGDGLAFCQIFKHMRSALSEDAADRKDDVQRSAVAEDAVLSPKLINEDSCGSSWEEFYRSIPSWVLAEDADNAFLPLPEVLNSCQYSSTALTSSEPAAAYL